MKRYRAEARHADVALLLQCGTHFTTWAWSLCLAAPIATYWLGGGCPSSSKPGATAKQPDGDGDDAEIIL